MNTGVEYSTRECSNCSEYDSSASLCRYGRPFFTTPDNLCRDWRPAFGRLVGNVIYIDDEDDSVEAWEKRNGLR